MIESLHDAKHTISPELPAFSEYEVLQDLYHQPYEPQMLAARSNSPETLSFNSWAYF